MGYARCARYDREMPDRVGHDRGACYRRYTRFARYDRKDDGVVVAALERPKYKTKR